MSEYSIFPKAIDGYAQLPLTVDRAISVSAEEINRLRSAIKPLSTVVTEYFGPIEWREFA